MGFPSLVGLSSVIPIFAIEVSPRNVEHGPIVTGGPRRWWWWCLSIVLSVTIMTAHTPITTWYRPTRTRGWCVRHHRSANLGRWTTTITTGGATAVDIASSSSSSRGQSIAPPSTADPSITIMHRALSVGKSTPIRNLTSEPTLVAIGIRKRHAIDAMWSSGDVVIVEKMVGLVSLPLLVLRLLTRNDTSNATIATLGRRVVLVMAVVGASTVRNFRSFREVIAVVVINNIATVMTGSAYHELGDWRHVSWGGVLAARMASIRVDVVIVAIYVVVVIFARTARGAAGGIVGKSTSILLATSSFPTTTTTKTTALRSHSKHVLNTAIGTVHQYDLPPTQ